MSVELTPAQTAVMAARPDGEPVVMVNLLKLRTDGGQVSCGRHLHEAADHFARRGGSFSIAAITRCDDRQWREPLVGRNRRRGYQIPAAFLDKVSDANFFKVNVYREDALDYAYLALTSSRTIAD